MTLSSHLAAILLAGMLAAAGTAKEATGPDGAIEDLPATAAPAAAPPAEPVRIGNPLWAIPLKSLHFTRERPLFVPSRRPPPAPVLGGPVAAPPPPRQPVEETPRLSLLGAITSSAQGIVVLLDQTTQDVVQLKIGEGHAGWILRSVKSREAVLERGGRSIVVEFPAPPGDAK